MRHVYTYKINSGISGHQIFPNFLDFFIFAVLFLRVLTAYSTVKYYLILCHMQVGKSITHAPIVLGAKKLSD